MEIADELAKRGQLKPEFANSIEECTDTSKLYVLPDGFIYAYIAGEESKPMYTNQLPISTDADGSVYNSTGYNVGYRLNSSSAVVALGTAGASNPAFVTGFIPATTGQTVRMESCYIDTDGINGSINSNETKAYYGHDCTGLNVLLCNSSKATMNAVGWTNLPTSDYFTATPGADGIVREFTIKRSGVSYIRLVLAGDAPNAIITVDEEIANSDGSQAGWRNTGRAFVPADYEDRIVALEKSLARGEVAVYGAVDENGDVLLCGPLDTGAHTFKYMQANGATAIIGTLTVAEG